MSIPKVHNADRTAALRHRALQGAAIGAGYFSHFHYDAWQRLPNVDIVAVCDTDLAKAKQVASKFGIAHVYSDREKMLDAHTVDFVDVITRPDTHLQIVRSIAARGLPIICQKPLAPSIAEAVALVRAASEVDVPLMVHENFRFQPWYRAIKQLFDSGLVGSKLHQLSFRNRAGDGWGAEAYLARQPYFQTMKRFLIFEAGIHTVDTFRYLSGEIDRVWCTTRRLNPVIAGEDAALAVFDFHGGGQGLYDANRYNESTAENQRYTFGEVTLEANGGTLRLYDDGRIGVQPLGELEREHAYQPTQLGFAGDCVAATQQHFMDCLRDGCEFETSGIEYLKSLAVQEAMYRSHDSGAWEQPVVLEL